VAQSEDGAVFVSRDGAQPPQLVITLEDMISTPITTSTSDPSVAEDAVPWPLGTSLIATWMATKPPNRRSTTCRAAIRP